MNAAVSGLPTHRIFNNQKESDSSPRIATKTSHSRAGTVPLMSEITHAASCNQGREIVSTTRNFLGGAHCAVAGKECFPLPADLLGDVGRAHVRVRRGVPPPAVAAATSAGESRRLRSERTRQTCGVI